MARLPKRLVGPRTVPAADTLLYTAPSYVPTTLTTIIRHIHVQNPSGSAVTLTLSIGADAVGTRLFTTYSIPAAAAGVTGSVIDYYWYVPMTTGETIRSSSGTDLILNLTISGDENCG